MEPKIKLELSFNDINLLLAGLGKLPYEAVYGLVDLVRQQVEPQIQNMQQSQGGELRSKTLPN